MDKFVAKFFMIPFLYFVMYSLTFYYGAQVVDKLNTVNHPLRLLIAVVFVSSSLSLVLTFIIFFISKRIWNELTFRRWYHYTHIIFVYFSGLMSVLVGIEPLLEKEKLLLTAIDDNFKFSLLIFFVIIANYSIFNSLILNDDFKFKAIK
ncbi:hypothetical protein [Paenibacillus rhizoplanae]|uniref:hypothetical protein n=1 Tax=Paenibacillus sp. FSL P2-0136 TaxID=2975317 RepID=UPI001AEA12E7